MPLQDGQTFAGYTILRTLGVGGMGEVYLAQHPRLPRPDALKILPKAAGSDEFRQRFNREADLAAQLFHPHIVGIHDRGEEDGQLWISMDYVAGTDANVLMSERYPTGMPARQAAEIITAVASALDYAHQRGLLHRDVKPANVLLADFETTSQRIFLADFGIARSMLEASGLTATNTTIGTIAYASPEQLSGRPMDGRSDQYSLACTAYDLLTGAAPFSGGDPMSIVGQHLSMPAPPIGYRQPLLTALDPVFARALAKDPQARYASCTDFANDLTRAIESGRASSAVAAPWPSAAPATTVAPTMPPAVPAQSGSRRTLLIIGGIVTVVVLAVAAIVAVTLSGDDSTVAGPGGTSSSRSSGTTPTPGETPAPGAAPDTPTPTSSALTFDGQPRAMSGRTICITQGTKVLITVVDMALPVAVTVGVGDDPVVQSVGLGRIDGVAYSYAAGVSDTAPPVAQKDGNSYTISGDVSGIDLTNPTQRVTKPFQLALICP